MAYDPDLAERIRNTLTHLPHKSMFGGLSFMVGDRIAVTANTHGDLMVRCDPNRVEELLNEEGAEWALMRGKPMSRGWLRIGREGIRTEGQLRFWVDVALEFNGRATG